MRHGRVLRAAVVCGVAALVLVGCGDDDEDGGPSVALQAPTNGSVVAGGVAVDMTADGLTIEAAGEVHDGAGHFHVILDDGCAAEGDTVAKDADHVHFGKGQSSGTVYLGPGEHELCLQAADGAHTALAATDVAKVTVGIESQDEWCDVIGETDDLFKAVDESSEDFAVKQTGYMNISRLIEQLDAGLDTVDDEVRADVKTALAWATSVTGVYTQATNMDDVSKRADEVFGTAKSELKAAAPWILDTCGVDIDG